MRKNLRFRSEKSEKNLYNMLDKLIFLCIDRETTV